MIHLLKYEAMLPVADSLADLGLPLTGKLTFHRIAGDPAVHPISIVPAHVPQHLTSHIRALIEEDPPVI